VKTYFFGVWGKHPGHGIHKVGGGYYRGEDLPFPYERLDGFNKNREQGKALLMKFAALNKTWTIISFSDYTGDSRPGSNAAFIAEGYFFFNEMIEFFKTSFPDQYNRITKETPITLMEVNDEPTTKRI
jgi:hypothetical protein